VLQIATSVYQIVMLQFCYLGLSNSYAAVMLAIGLAVMDTCLMFMSEMICHLVYYVFLVPIRDDCV